MDSDKLLKTLEGLVEKMIEEIKTIHDIELPEEDEFAIVDETKKGDEFVCTVPEELFMYIAKHCDNMHMGIT